MEGEILAIFFKALDEQRYNGSSSDIIKITFSDGTEIPVHRSLLMAASDSFRRMLTNGMKESNQKEISFEPPHIDGFKAMIEQVCYGKKDDKISYEIKIWRLICKHAYLVPYDPAELITNVPADGLGLLLHLAKVLEHNDAIKQVVANNCLEHNADIPPEISDTETTRIVLFHEAEKYFYVYKIIGNKIYSDRSIRVFYNNVENLKRYGKEISYQCCDGIENKRISYQRFDGKKFWTMILNRFNDIGDYVCFSPSKRGGKIYTDSPYALHPTKDHILMVGIKYIYVFDYRERKLVDKYEINFNPSEAKTFEDIENFDYNTTIRKVIFSCNGKYTLYITNNNKYIFEGPKMIEKLGRRTYEAKFHPTEDNIIVLQNFLDDDRNILVVYDIAKDAMYNLIGLEVEYNYYFSANGEYIYIEDKANRRLGFLPLKPNLTKYNYHIISGIIDDLDTNTKTLLVPDPKNEYGIYYCINGEMYWINMDTGMCISLQDVHDCLPTNISGMLILKETHN